MRYNLSHSPDRRFVEDAVRFYAVQLIIALEHCHKLCILHRDVKPENILLTQSGYIKVRARAMHQLA
jgi:serine/threonine protein kinase